MWKFLDHPSETLIQVNASTIDEVFEEAAVALFEIMTDTGVLSLEESSDIKLDSSERDLLFIDWLNRLLYLHETENVFFGRFEAHVHANGEWRVNGTARGQKFRPETERRSHAKSVTYGLFSWIENTLGHEVRFVVDI